MPRPVRWPGRSLNGDPAKGETNTNAPLVVKDKVITGISGGEYGVRGFVVAYDIATGRQVWKAYSVGPDAEHVGRPAAHDAPWASRSARTRA